MNINFLIVKALFDYSNDERVEATLRAQIKDAY